MLPILVALLAPLSAQNGTVVAETKVSNLAGGLPCSIAINERFGSGLAGVRDLDGNGVDDLAVGSLLSGVLRLLTLDTNLGVAGCTEFTGASICEGTNCADGQFFGSAIASLGDLDGNGFDELAVAERDEGTLWILYLASGPSVSSAVAIEGASIGAGAMFGQGVDCLGDLDGDGFTELIVGDISGGVGGSGTGEVWILSIDSSGSVVGSPRKIAEGVGGFTGSLSLNDAFGVSVAALGDVNGDGTTDAAVGAFLDDGSLPGTQQGAVWILFLQPDGSVSGQQKITNGSGGLGSPLVQGDWFGLGVTGLGDIDADCVPDLLVGAPGEMGTVPGGSVWVLSLNADGTVKTALRTQMGSNGFVGPLSSGDQFGARVEALGDLDGDGSLECAIGAPLDDDGANAAGAVWLLSFARSPGTVGSFVNYGCANPSGSLRLLDGRPRVGETVTLGVDNPLGTQTPGSPAVLKFSFGPDPAFPCGTLRPKWGMAGGGAPGEILIDLSRILPTGLLLATWGGVGAPAEFPIPLPYDCQFVGVTTYAQAAILDPLVVFPRVALTEAAEMTVGVGLP